MEQPIFCLFIYIVVTDVIVTGPDVIKSLLFIAIVVYDVIMEPCSFTLDEANVEDLVKADVLTKFILLLRNLDLSVTYRVYT